MRAKQPGRLPVVLGREEVRTLLDGLSGTPRSICILLYGSGLRLLEALQLRVKDVDFAGGEIRVRRAKRAKDRVTVLPGGLTAELERHLERVCRQHQQDLARGDGKVALPYAFERKSPGAAKEWSWQYVFPAARRYLHPSGDYRRHHVYESAVQRAVKGAAQGAGIAKRVTCHSLRHSWDVATMMIYTHVWAGGAESGGPVVTRAGRRCSAHVPFSVLRRCGAYRSAARSVVLTGLVAAGIKANGRGSWRVPV